MVAIHHLVVMSTSMYHRRQQRQPYIVHIRAKVATEIHHTRDQKTKNPFDPIRLTTLIRSSQGFAEQIFVF